MTTESQQAVSQRTAALGGIEQDKMSTQSNLQRKSLVGGRMIRKLNRGIAIHPVIFFCFLAMALTSFIIACTSLHQTTNDISVTFPNTALKYQI
jgi:hypothetical protein